jgi:hypothetical protein
MEKPDTIKSSYERLGPNISHNKKGSERVRVSNFFITMNTNKWFKPVDVSENVDIEPLYTAAEKLFVHDADIKQFVVFKDGLGAWDPRFIMSVSTQTKVELGQGKHGSRLHVHIGLKIRHKSFLELNIALIKERMNEELKKLGYGYPMHHIDVKVHRPSMEDYLYK